MATADRTQTEKTHLLNGSGQASHSQQPIDLRDTSSVGDGQDEFGLGDGEQPVASDVNAAASSSDLFVQFPQEEEKEEKKGQASDSDHDTATLDPNGEPSARGVGPRDTAMSGKTPNSHTIDSDDNPSGRGVGDRKGNTSDETPRPSFLARVDNLETDPPRFHKQPKRPKSYFYELLTAATITVAAVLILLAYLDVFPLAANPLMIFGGGMMIVATALLHWTHRILLSNSNTFGNKWHNTSIEWRFAAAISIGLSVALILAPIYLPAFGAATSFFVDWGLVLSATGAVLAALIAGLHLRHISQQKGNHSSRLIKNSTPISWKPFAATASIGLSIAFILVPIYLSAFGFAASFFADWRFLFTLTGVVLGALGAGLYIHHLSQKGDHNSVQFLEKAKAISWKGVLIFSVLLLGVMGFAAGRTSEWAPEFFASSGFWGLNISVQTLFVQGGTLVLVLTAVIQLIRIIKQPLDLARSPVFAAGRSLDYGSANSADRGEDLVPSQGEPDLQQRLRNLVATRRQIEDDITKLLDQRVAISIIMPEAVHREACDAIELLRQAIADTGIDSQALSHNHKILFSHVTTQLAFLGARQAILMQVTSIDTYLQDGQLTEAHTEILSLCKKLTSFKTQFNGDPLLIEPAYIAKLEEEDLPGGGGLLAALARQRVRLKAKEREKDNPMHGRFEGDMADLWEQATSGEESPPLVSDKERDLRKAQEFGRKRPPAFTGIEKEEGEGDKDKDRDSDAPAPSSLERKHTRPEAEKDKQRAASFAAAGGKKRLPALIKASILASAASERKEEGESTTPTDPTTVVTASPDPPPPGDASASAIGYFAQGRPRVGAGAPTDEWDFEESPSPRTFSENESSP